MIITFGTQVIGSQNSSGGQNPFTTEYQTVLERATTLGYALPSAAQQIKQNQLVIDLKACGAWTALDVLWVFRTNASSDFATLNWKNPNVFQCIKVNSPTFLSDQGFKGNGSTSYINTTWAPNQGLNYTQNDCSSICGLADQIQENSGRAFGVANSGNTIRLEFLPRTSLNQGAAPTNSNGSQAFSISDSIGLFHNRRTTSNSIDIIRDNVQIGTLTETSSGVNTIPVYVLARNANGTATGFSQRTIEILGFGGAMSSIDTQLYNAWTTYKN